MNTIEINETHLGNFVDKLMIKALHDSGSEYVAYIVQDPLPVSSRLQDTWNNWGDDWAIRWFRESDPAIGVMVMLEADGLWSVNWLVGSQIDRLSHKFEKLHEAMKVANIIGRQFFRVSRKIKRENKQDE